MPALTIYVSQDECRSLGGRTSAVIRTRFSPEARDNFVGQGHASCVAQVHCAPKNCRCRSWVWDPSGLGGSTSLGAARPHKTKKQYWTVSAPARRMSHHPQDCIDTPTDTIAPKAQVSYQDGLRHLGYSQGGDKTPHGTLNSHGMLP